MPPPRRNRRWIWFFVVVAVLTVAAIVILIRVNEALQLTPKTLEAAWTKWKEKGPPDYDLIYTVDKPGSQTEHFEVHVRDKRTVFLALNGKAQPDRLYPYYGMDELFDQVSEFLRKDSEPGKPRPYAVASFDEKDGHILKYIRAVRGTGERVEIQVQELRPLSASDKK